MNDMRYVAHRTEIAARMLGEEMMIMSERDSSLFSLNEIASVIWQAADGVTPLEEIVERRICAQFDVEPAAALRDAEEMVDKLAAEGILIVSDSPIPPKEQP